MVMAEVHLAQPGTLTISNGNDMAATIIAVAIHLAFKLITP